MKSESNRSPRRQDARRKLIKHDSKTIKKKTIAICLFIWINTLEQQYGHIYVLIMKQLHVHVRITRAHIQHGILNKP